MLCQKVTRQVDLQQHRQTFNLFCCCFRDTIIVCLADCLTSFFSGFVVFAVVGYMAVEMKQPIEEVATAGK